LLPVVRVDLDSGCSAPTHAARTQPTGVSRLRYCSMAVS
jgi:hypothetical protein